MLLLIGFVLFDVGVPEKIPGAFFVSVAPCGHTAIVLCSAYNVNPENIVKALFLKIRKNPTKFIKRSALHNFSKERSVCDFIAGMTDRYATNLYNSIK